MHLARCGHGDTTLNLQGESPAGQRLRTPVAAEFVDGGPSDLAISQDPMGCEGMLVPVSEMGMPTPGGPAITYSMTQNRPEMAKGADLSCQGRIDLVYLHAGPDDSTPGTTFSVVLNTALAGPPVFSAPTPYATGDAPRDFEIIDLNGDTFKDIIISSSGPDLTVPTDPMRDWAGPGPESLYIYHNDANGNFTEAESIIVADRLVGLAVANFDCDGEDDIVVGSMRGTIHFLAGDQSGSFDAPTTIFDDAGVVYGLEAAHMNNDGRPDLVWSGWTFSASAFESPTSRKPYSSRMWCLGSTGRTIRLATRATSSSAAMVYMVLL